MIKLYAYEPALGMPSGSPFVVKTMILLKMAGCPFDIEIMADPSSSPKGKLPFLRDEGETIADSELIRHHLETRHQATFFADLTPEERGVGLGLQRLAEEHLYWCGMYHHWQIDAHWPALEEMFFGVLSADQREAIAEEVRSQVLRDLRGHGLGRHSEEEMLHFARSDLAALSDALGDRPFYFGDNPTGIDAAIAPQILTITRDPFEAPLNHLIKSFANLEPYADRILEQFFPATDE